MSDAMAAVELLKIISARHNFKDANEIFEAYKKCLAATKEKRVGWFDTTSLEK